MADIGWDHDGIAFAQFRLLVASDRMPDPALNHDQRLRAIGVVMTAIRVAWLQHATANRHLVAVS